MGADLGSRSCLVLLFKTCGLTGGELDDTTDKNRKKIKYLSVIPSLSRNCLRHVVLFISQDRFTDLAVVTPEEGPHKIAPFTCPDPVAQLVRAPSPDAEVAGLVPCQDAFAYKNQPTKA